MCTSTVVIGALLASSKLVHAEDRFFNELRFGASTSIQSGRSREDGVFPEVVALFDPFGFEQVTGWKQQLLHPRLHAGSSIGTFGEATQFYGGLTWTVDLGEKLFVEAGFGGAVHTGNLDEDDNGPDLGSRLLFREYLAAGINLQDGWRLVAQVAHASNASICDGPNEGMTRAGVLVAYKF
ncbi:acyloxyacyl hydrolase [Rhizobiaceae bacterium n13]|uniref:Acyloxyacyl hydrolase n=2 Tax=Ferirhizobium litorale TaxID=2927786 RepID=A0AAE3U415_9HYPH|nr:acyloxyacyl hydrolase [Fererhizobium litorale]MDI7863318.1 acyloxyacyl hydrolase [Fererhizobium litorale]MDI7922948.1 acyloxyacyl hydrolase [Fererhizobium litorale]